MNWKKSLCIAILTGAALTALAGCGQTGENAAASVQTSVAAQSTNTPAKQVPPSGMSDNGTRPSLPSGNFTGERPSAQAMDLAAVAAKLGITETQLSEALGNTRQGLSDLAAAAAKLGITENVLREALGFSNNGTMPGSLPSGAAPPPASAK
jgi:hypothetical protein